MKLHFERKKNQRFYKQFHGVQLDFDQPYYWFDRNINQWTLTPLWDLGDISNTFGRCRSVKAFRRRLYEWSKYLPEGLTFRLISRYKDSDVYGKTYKINKQL